MNDIELLKNLIIKLNESGSLGIDIIHIIENIRVNGWQRKVSIFDIYEDTKELKSRIKAEKKDILNDEKILLEILKIFKDYKICPTCKGRKGITHNEYHPGQFWKDCSICNGIGMIKKE